MKSGYLRIVLGVIIILSIFCFTTMLLLIWEIGWVTVIALTVEACMILYYLIFRSRTIHLYKLKLTIKSIRLTIRNIWYQIKLGISGLLGESAIGFMMIVGNLIFIRYLGEEGIAAFSVACYCFPIIFMLNAAISQSAQPMISFNHGVNNRRRVYDSSKLALVTAVFSGLAISTIMILEASLIIGLFLNSNTGPFEIAIHGIPLFAIAYPFFAFNVVAIGNYQSVERGNRATVYTILRGFIFMPFFFILLPRLFGTSGIWLTVPCAEILTTLVIIYFYYKKKTTVTHPN